MVWRTQAHARVLEVHGADLYEAVVHNSSVSRASGRHTLSSVKPAPSVGCRWELGVKNTDGTSKLGGKNAGQLYAQHGEEKKKKKKHECRRTSRAKSESCERVCACGGGDVVSLFRSNTTNTAPDFSFLYSYCA